MNDVHDMSLANNKYYTLVVVLIIYWLATFISLKGMSWVGKVAKIGGMVGTIIPAALLIILGIIYLASGGHSNMDFNSSFLPPTLPTLIMLFLLPVSSCFMPVWKWVVST